MAGRLSLSFLLFKLPRPHWDGARQKLLFRCLSCSPTSSSASGSRRGPFSKDSPLAKLEDSFKLLGVRKDECTVEQIRAAYIDLVKQYHPDARTPQASAQRFAEVCIFTRSNNLWIILAICIISVTLWRYTGA